MHMYLGEEAIETSDNISYYISVYFLRGTAGEYKMLVGQ
jgi:hypothetical protein